MNNKRMIGFRFLKSEGDGFRVVACIISACLLGFSGLSTMSAADLEFGIEHDGDSVRLSFPPSRDRKWLLEVQRYLNENREWKQVLRLNSGDNSAVWNDPSCRVKPSRFYRLRSLDGADTTLVDNFKLLDQFGDSHELYYNTHYPLVSVVLVGSNLENIQGVLPELNSVRAKYLETDILVWAVHCDHESNPEDIASRADALGIDFPVLHDSSDAVTRNLNPQEFPEVVAITPSDFSSVYRGAISVTVETEDGAETFSYLADAIEQHFAQETVTIEQAQGVSVTGDALLDPLPSVSYSEDVAPILLDSCVGCHSPGNIGPFAMTSFDVVREYAPVIKHQVMSGEMPPWHLDRHFREFSNDISLSDDEKLKIVRWINDGAPRGDGPDPLTEAETSPPTEWPLGEPDYIVEIPQEDIPADGVVDYKYHVVASPVPNDVWLKGAAVLPGDAEVVHHSLVFAVDDPSNIFALQGGLAGFFAAYVPGMAQDGFPEGTGKFLPASSFFVFQQHYTPVGEARSDITRMGLYVADEEPELELKTSSAFSLALDILPGDRNSETSASVRVRRDSWIYEMSPHMHYRGTRFKFEALYPDGNSEVILSNPDYHFDWQQLYRLREPVFLPAGTEIVCSGAFDNSSENRWNPDSTRRVRFGEQSWDEMFIGYFNFAEARP